MLQARLERTGVWSFYRLTGDRVRRSGWQLAGVVKIQQCRLYDIVDPLWGQAEQCMRSYLHDPIDYFSAHVIDAWALSADGNGSLPCMS